MRADYKNRRSDKGSYILNVDDTYYVGAGYYKIENRAADFMTPLLFIKPTKILNRYLLFML